MIKIFLRIISILYYKLTGEIITHSFYENKIKKSFIVDRKVGIVIQGNVVNKEFLIQTIINYKKLYPNVFIVLSTWKDSNKEIINEIEKIKNVKIILNDYPKFYGIKNINLQIISTLNALNYLKKNGYEFAIKSRSDQRLCQYESNYIDHFISVVSNSLKFSNTINSKLIFSTMNSFNDRYYPISDMFMFGLIDDLMLYWDCKLDTKNVKDINVEDDSHYFMRQATAEGYLLTNFMNKVKYIPSWNKECSDNFLNKYFYTVDYEFIRQFWFKNNWYYDYSFLNNNLIKSFEFNKK